MRIRITVEDVTPAQHRWLLDHVDVVWPLGTGGMPVCVEFVGSAGEVFHREVGARRWLEIIEQLRNLTRTAEAVLTPDVPELPPIFPPYPG